MLVAGVVQYDKDRFVLEALSQTPEQLCYHLGIDVDAVVQTDKFQGCRMDDPEDINPKAAGSRTDEYAFETPDNGDKSSQDKMGAIQKKEVALTGGAFFQ